MLPGGQQRIARPTCAGLLSEHNEERSEGWTAKRLTVQTDKIWRRIRVPCVFISSIKLTDVGCPYYSKLGTPR